MRIFEAVERLPIKIPISDVMGSDGSFDFLPEVREKGYFDIDYRKNELILVAGKYIGQIPLTEEIIIHVHPKVPMSNLARVIGTANQPVRCLDFFRRKYELDGAASQSLLQAMAHSLTASLRELDAEGMYREYIIKREQLSTIRGRIDVPAFVQRSLARGHSTNISCNYFELSADTMLNRLIKRAVHVAGLLLSQSGSTDRELVRQLSYYADCLDAVPLDNSIHLISRARDQLARQRIPDLRHYYLDILDACFVILEGNGVELKATSGRNKLHSFVVNLEDAFEHYIRQVLLRALSSLDLNLVLLDGNNDGKSLLFADNKDFDAKPDLIINRDGVTTALGDVKYKTKISESDRYQLISHALSFGARNAFIVSPATDKNNVGARYIGTIGVSQPIKIFQYLYDLECEDLVEAEKTFADWTVTLTE